jgi:hypothetical protein
MTRDGRRIRFTGKIASSPPTFHEGDTVTVLYDATDPSHATIQSFEQLWLLPVMFSGMGLLFVAIPAGIMYAGARGRERAEWLKQNGYRISTTFERVARDMVEVNNVHPYRIISQGQNPFTGIPQTFKSKRLWSDPTQYLANRSIDVLIDPSNPKRYWVDTSFLPAEE